MTTLEGPAEAMASVDEAGDWKANLAATTALGITAALAVVGQKYGVTEDLPPGLKESAESLGHPVFGMASAWAANEAIKLTGRDKLRAWWVGVTASGITTVFVNGTAEKVQSEFWASDEYADFLASRNLDESGKDQVFAFIGVGIYYGLKRWLNRRKESNIQEQ